MLIASRVLKTRNSIETRAFKTHFTRFASPLMWKIVATWRFQIPTHTVSLNLSNTLSVSQALSLSLSNTLKVQIPKSVKRSSSNAHRPRRATKITLTVKRSPFSSDHIPTIPSPIPWKSLLSLPTKVQILLFLKVCFS